MSELFDSEFRDMKRLYGETMEEIGEALKMIAEYPEAECVEYDAPEYIEAAVAESHCKILSLVIEKAMKTVGRSIFKALDKEE